jgi:hypothetical protein
MRAPTGAVRPAASAGPVDAIPPEALRELTRSAPWVTFAGWDALPSVCLGAANPGHGRAA